MLRRVAHLVFWLMFFLIFTSVIGTAWYFIHGYQEIITAKISTDSLNEPRQAIVIQFPQSMRPVSLVGKVTLTPDVPFITEWHEWNRELAIIPDTDWPIGKDIKISIGSGSTQWLRKSMRSSFLVKGPQTPKVLSFWPEQEAKDVILGVEDPIRIELDRSSRNFFLDFRIEPSVPVIYQNNPEKTYFEILPQKTLGDGERYTIEVWAKWHGSSDDSYHYLAKSDFTTAPPAPVTWSRDLSKRVEEALRFTRPKKTDGRYVDINLASQVMTLFENGRAIDAFIISSGKYGMETPKGEFAIRNKADRPWSKKYSLFMPYWQAITSDGLFGIHELPEWPGGYKEGANHLGTPVSHGCVRLGVGPARRVYEWTDIGTPVVVY